MFLFSKIRGWTSGKRMESSEASLMPENPEKPLNDAELGQPSSPLPPPLKGNPDPPPSDLGHEVDEVRLLCEELRDVYLKEQQEVVMKLGLIGNEGFIGRGEENSIGYESDNGNESETDVANGGVELVEKKDGGFSSRKYQYPIRPEAEDCVFYMKTGTCKFKSYCKYNHPFRRKTNLKVVKERLKQTLEPFERPEQIECKYYLTSGGCKYGSACGYNHSKAKISDAPAILELNFVGLPIRLGEKECVYYMRTGSCKYGVNCRFNHPDPTIGGSDTSSGFPSGGQTSLQDASQSDLAYWSGPRSLNDNYETAPFVPMMLSPTQGVTSHNTEWNECHQAPINVSERGLPLPPAYLMNNSAIEANIYTQYPPQKQAVEFPERPGQPECIYYLKTGDCKFKSNCRYHHPKNRSAVPPPCSCSDKGLPLRPDENICSFYGRYGICKFGPSCKFNHPDQPDFVLDPDSPYGGSAMLDEAGTIGSGHRSGSSIEQLL